MEKSLYKVGDEIKHTGFVDSESVIVVEITNTDYVLKFAGSRDSSNFDFDYIHRNCRKLTKLEKALK